MAAFAQNGNGCAAKGTPGVDVLALVGGMLGEGVLGPVGACLQLVIIGLVEGEVV